jgi:hypothetical protein
VIAQIPNLLATAPHPQLFPLGQYISGGTPSAYAIVGTLPTGWSFGGNTLTYHGTGVGTSAVQLQVTWSGGTVVSNTFTVQSVAAVVTDTTAPTVPVGVNATYVQGSPVALSFVPSSDPSFPGQAWSGIKSYAVTRSVNGAAYAPLTTIVSTAGVQFVAAPQDIGSPATAGTTSQTGATFTMTGTGNAYYGTADQGQYAPFQVTGNFIATWSVVSCTSSYQYSECGLDVRQDLTAGSVHVNVCHQAIAQGLGYNMDYRTASGGASSTIGSATCSPPGRALIPMRWALPRPSSRS